MNIPSELHGIEHVLEKILSELGAVRASQKNFQQWIETRDVSSQEGHSGHQISVPLQVSTVGQDPGVDSEGWPRDDVLSLQSEKELDSVVYVSSEHRASDGAPFRDESLASVMSDYPIEESGPQKELHDLGSAFAEVGLAAFADENGPKYLKSKTMCLAEKHAPQLHPGQTVRLGSRRSRHNAQTIFTRIVFHSAFEPVSACIIMIHAAAIGAYVNSVAASPNGTAVDVLAAINQVLVVVFIIETVLKIGAERWVYFVGPERFWNWFDLLLAGTVTCDVGVALFAHGDEHRKFTKKVMNLGEITRTFRVLRIFRVLRFSPALRVIISKIFAAFWSIVWVLVLIFLMIYVMAVTITVGATQSLEDISIDAKDSPAIQAVDFHFGSLSKSLLTVFQAVSGGMTWGDIQEPLETMSIFFTIIFMAFIGFTVFAGLNIVTGIFVDAALQAAIQERDLIMERHAQIEEVSVEHLREVFFDMDNDETGWLTHDKFRECLMDDRICAYMHFLKIDTSDAAQLFRMLDLDNSGEILIDEFVEGCMKLRGDAKSMDIHILMCESRRCWLKFGHFCEKLVESIEDIGRSVGAESAARALRAPTSLFASAPASARCSYRFNTPSGPSSRRASNFSIPSGLPPIGAGSGRGSYRSQAGGQLGISQQSCISSMAPSTTTVTLNAPSDNALPQSMSANCLSPGTSPTSSEKNKRTPATVAWGPPAAISPTLPQLDSDSCIGAVPGA